MQEFVPAASMSALVIVVINFLRYARARDLDGVATIAAAWVAGVIAVSLAAQSDFAGSIEFGGSALSAMNLWSQVFAGMSLASVGSFAVDIRKALDNNDSAVKPSLVAGKAKFQVFDGTVNILPDGPLGTPNRPVPAE